jgi:aspartyl-tRNA(Asn)/glutamyl-tRNA(Gln) amidotransferase subunit B
MSEYEATIGLEIHAELKTKTKMFCRSANDPFTGDANVHVCPVCMAHPGTLPVINREAVRHVLRVGAAIGGKLADYTEFDRKNYFYPDLPKGYQLSQYEYPLVAGGELAGVALTRIHLEEDTASSIHSEASGATVIDYNRAGVPLMELVTEPVIESAEQAGKFARELQLLLRYIGASEANMEKGEMRVEANVSIKPKGSSTLGTKVEIKNLNSFNAMERAVRYEIERQKKMLDNGEKVEQHTLGWDERKQATFSQRTKEGSADYRYFPDPDLPSLRISEVADFSGDALKADMPELPSERRARYAARGVHAEHAELYVRNPHIGAFFDEVAGGLSLDEAKLASNYIANDLMSLLRTKQGNETRDAEERDTFFQDNLDLSAADFRTLVGMLASRQLSSKAGKDILGAMVREGVEPRSYAKEQKLLQETDAAALESAVEDAIEANPGVVEDYRAGKAAALEYLLGQCMKALRGAADPAVLRELLAEKLGA